MQGQVQELRVVVTTNDYEEALHFYKDVLGLKQQPAVTSDAGRVAILQSGKATLKLVDQHHAEFIDQQEVGKRVAGHIRLAFQVDDAAGITNALESAGANVLARPTSAADCFYRTRFCAVQLERLKSWLVLLRVRRWLPHCLSV